METDSRFTPWTKCGPLAWTKCGPLGSEAKHYFIGRFVCPRRGVTDLWVRTDWSGRALRSGMATWEIEKSWSLPSDDPANVRLKFLNDFVLENWWLIVNSAPKY